MQAALDPLARILALNTDLLLNTLDGVTDDEARHRLPGGGNSLGFIAAHLADSRHFLANLIGRPLENPLAPVLAGARSIEDVRGQAAFVRRQLGHPAMSYRRKPVAAG